MPIRPTTEPTDRSMLRDTITRTMPVARTAVDAAWTENVRKLTGSRITGLAMPRPIQITTSARTMPNSRRSISVARISSPMLDRLPPSAWFGAVPAASVIDLLLTRHLPVGGMNRRPAPRGGAGRLNLVRKDQLQAGGDPAVTPAQTASFVAQPASIVSFRLSLVIAVGVRMTDWTDFPPGVENAAASRDAGAAALGRSPGAFTAVIAVPAQSCIAMSSAVSPRAKAFFQTETACVPRATRFSAAVSPS